MCFLLDIFIEDYFATVVVKDDVRFFIFGIYCKGAACKSPDLFFIDDRSSERRSDNGGAGLTEVVVLVTRIPNARYVEMSVKCKVGLYVLAK